MELSFVILQIMDGGNVGEIMRIERRAGLQPTADNWRFLREPCRERGAFMRCFSGSRSANLDGIGSDMQSDAVQPADAVRPAMDPAKRLRKSGKTGKKNLLLS
jgi:hypothetical protein